MSDSTRILIVEDHEDSAACLLKLLRHSGYEAVVARSCDEALRMAAEQRFDVALCDISLPDGDGCDLYHRLASMHPVRGIALTGHGMEKDLERFYQAGFSAHLIKPYALKDVLSAIATAVGRPGQKI